jgi:hypothetical protein
VTKLILLALASSAIVLGCAPQSSPSSEPQTFNARQELVAASGGDYFSYQYVESGCTTGRHTFDDHAQLCRTLRDEAANNFCAFEQRRAYYAQECR